MKLPEGINLSRYFAKKQNPGHFSGNRNGYLLVIPPSTQKPFGKILGPVKMGRLLKSHQKDCLFFLCFPQRLKVAFFRGSPTSGPFFQQSRLKYSGTCGSAPFFPRKGETGPPVTFYSDSDPSVPINDLQGDLF
ncbi:MAG: hypothetical protein CM15mP130_2350 [Verrucomicrobiota bacterium]|nr:MAG: hypothetical protein CM15mP130_2350 [Verrucomicrobiota bacterium]